MKQMGRRSDRISIIGNGGLQNNPFGSLSANDFKATPLKTSSSTPVSKLPPKKSRGRLDVKREKSGRGGKTVTTIYGMQTIEVREREQLLKKMKTSCGVGGTMKGAVLELQGDNRDAAKAILESAGFQVVFAGG